MIMFINLKDFRERDSLSETMFLNLSGFLNLILICRMIFYYMKDRVFTEM